VRGGAGSELLGALPGHGAAGIDWNQAWSEARARRTRRSGSAGWDKRAASFASHSARSVYAERLLARMAPDPSWTVLDVGCGAGALAVPLARRTRSVTALDFSPRMLELVRERAVVEGLGNIAPVLGSWEDDWERLGVGLHDVALASRSLTTEDLRAALLKLDRAARRQVFLTAPVGTGPVDGRVLEAAGRPFVPGPDYIYPYNLLHQLGILASVEFIPVVQERSFESVERAVDGLCWMLPEPAPEELSRLRAWLVRQRAPGSEAVALPPRTIHWAVLSWSKGAG
jgi:SAM-dependent methyltransferase